MKLSVTPRRAIDRFLQDPASIRIAAWLIIGSTVAVVLAGSLVMRVFDRREYPNFGRAVWFTLQTVTTVGYGDVTPTRIIGRVVAGVVMVTGIGFITVVTACVTSVFVEASRRRSEKADEATVERIAATADADLTELSTRLEQIERTLAVLVERTRPG
jgi:voltage-gated potassium channel